MANQISQIKNWTVWHINGSMDINTSPKLDEEGQKVLTAAKNLVADLSDVGYLSSAGLRVIIRLAKRAKKDGKSFALSSAKGMVANVLKESKMDMLVTIFNSLDELD